MSNTRLTTTPSPVLRVYVQNVPVYAGPQITRSQIDTVTTERASYMLTNPPRVFHRTHFCPNKSNGSL